MFLEDEATGLTTVDSSCFESQQVHAIFLFSNTFRSAQGVTDPLIQRVPEFFSVGKRLGREAKYSPPCLVEFSQ
jgi:hypothetical protein